MGDKDTVMAFKSLGVDVFPVLNEREGGKTLMDLARKKYAIIFVTEQIAEMIPEQIDSFRNEVIPAITLIPNNRGSLGIGLRNIKQSVERAIGVDIFMDEGEGEE